MAAPDSDTSRPSRPDTFAGKLNRLFEVLRPAGGKPVTTREIARRVAEQGGSISPGYISELRNGVKTKPGMEHVAYLAGAFGISAGYFTDPEVADRVDAELDRLEEHHRSSRLVDLAERTASLDASDRVALAALVDRYLQERDEPGAR
jgi:transcriptional regulator with XRE-family HTH domain